MLPFPCCLSISLAKKIQKHLATKICFSINILVLHVNMRKSIHLRNLTEIQKMVWKMYLLSSKDNLGIYVQFQWGKFLIHVQNGKAKKSQQAIMVRSEVIRNFRNFGELQILNLGETNMALHTEIDIHWIYPANSGCQWQKKVYRHSLLNMLHSPGGDWNPGWGVDPIHTVKKCQLMPALYNGKPSYNINHSLYFGITSQANSSLSY